MSETANSSPFYSNLSSTSLLSFCTTKTPTEESPCEAFCHHSPQCVLRQPKPPPAEKCKVLIHPGSNYHEHIISERGVPSRFSTHDYCMRIEYENYGCQDCVWFKWWGELHGYPDINPWDFKEHLEPLIGLF